MFFKFKKVVNLTPHPINFITSYNIEIGRDEMGTPEYAVQERIHSVPASGTIARCKVERKEVDSIIAQDVDGWDITVPITKTKFGEVEGLPEPQKDTIYIVSNLVAQAVPDREDVFFPDDIVRDEHGNVIGCRALGKI
jgi:hypothetical protein